MKKNMNYMGFVLIQKKTPLGKYWCILKNGLCIQMFEKLRTVKKWIQENEVAKGMKNGTRTTY